MEGQPRMTKLFHKSVLMAPSSSDLLGHYTAVTVVMRVLSLFTGSHGEFNQKERIISNVIPSFLPVTYLPS